MDILEKVRLVVARSYSTSFPSVGLLFFGAFVMGILLKLVLGPVMTIGYDDYRLASAHRAISLIESQERILQEGGSFAYVPKRGSGPVCADSKEE